MSGVHYIDSMPEDIREKWIGNLNSIQWRKHEFGSFKIFITCTLNWELTNEGHEYWARINEDDALITKIERDAKLFELGV